MRANAPEEFRPPAMANFARKLWDSTYNHFFNYWLPDYLVENGIDPGKDPTSRFIELEQQPETKINVERLFEYCWNNKGKKFKDDWENLIEHGVLGPLTFLLLMGFYEDGAIKRLEAGMLASSQLQDGDVVLNLNYETLFEIAAIQQGQAVTYAPYKFEKRGLWVVKPHGSLNLLADDRRFWFAQPDCVGALPSASDNYRNWRAIIPPRFNKSYEQHPTARIILDAIHGVRPDILTYWGVGLTDSDADLLELYRRWSSTAGTAEVINPNAGTRAVTRAHDLLGVPIKHFLSLEDWVAGQAYRTLE